MTKPTPSHFARILRFGIVFLCSAACGFAAPISTTNALLANGRFATEYYVNDSGQSGPTLFIVGGAHGNEPAGAAAAEQIRRWPLTKGKLVVIPRCNVPALAAAKRNIPGLAADLSNLNRNYPRAKKNEPARGELALAIWNLATKSKADWILDLHEGFDFNQINDNSVGSSVICFPIATGQTAADLMLKAVNDTVTDPQLKFVRRDMPVDGSLARAAGEHLRVPGMTLETTSKQPLEKRVRQHETMVHCLLAHLGMMGDIVPVASAVTTPATSTGTTTTATATAQVRVALYKGPGTGGAGPPNLMQRLNNGTQSSITQVTPEEIQNGVLTNYDVVIFAGGSGSRQAEAIGEVGRAEVKKFVSRGGGYIGICAGAYLATSGYPWSLHIINAQTVSPKWQRGVGDVKVELVDAGKQILGSREGQFDVHYANGPIVKPADEKSLPPYQPLAFFRTELAKNDSPAGVMVNAPAIFAGQYKGGRVVCISPHPEQTQGLDDFVPKAIEWLLAPKHGTNSALTAPKGE